MPEAAQDLLVEVHMEEETGFVVNPRGLRNRRDLIASSGYWSSSKKALAARADDRLVDYSQEPRRRIFPSPDIDEVDDDDFHRDTGLIRRTSLTLAQENGPDSILAQRRRLIRRGDSSRSAISLTMRPFTRARAYVENAITPGMLESLASRKKYWFQLLTSVLDKMRRGILGSLTTTVTHVPATLQHGKDGWC